MANTIASKDEIIVTGFGEPRTAFLARAAMVSVDPILVSHATKRHSSGAVNV